MYGLPYLSDNFDIRIIFTSQSQSFASDGASCFSTLMCLIVLFFFLETTKCVHSYKPAPRSQLVCSKSGGIDSCYLSCPSNTLFLPGLYIALAHKPHVSFDLGPPLYLFSTALTRTHPSLDTAVALMGHHLCLRELVILP